MVIVGWTERKIVRWCNGRALPFLDRYEPKNAFFSAVYVTCQLVLMLMLYPIIFGARYLVEYPLACVREMVEEKQW